MRRHAGDTAEIQLTREAYTLAQLTGVGVDMHRRIDDGRGTQDAQACALCGLVAGRAGGQVFTLVFAAHGDLRQRLLRAGALIGGQGGHT